VAGEASVRRLRLAEAMPSRHGRHRAICRASHVQPVSPGEALGRGEAIGASSAAKDLAASEKSPVNDYGRRGQRGGTVPDKWGWSVSGTTERK
jgi:hypothetical protein